MFLKSWSVLIEVVAIPFLGFSTCVVLILGIAFEDMLSSHFVNDLVTKKASNRTPGVPGRINAAFWLT